MGGGVMGGSLHSLRDTAWPRTDGNAPQADKPAAAHNSFDINIIAYPDRYLTSLFGVDEADSRNLQTMAAAVMTAVVYGAANDLKIIDPVSGVANKRSFRLADLVADSSVILDFATAIGVSPLMVAAAIGNDAAITAICAKPFTDINRQTKDGWTALHYAAHFGKTAAVEALLAARPDLLLETRDGKTAFDLCADEKTKQAFLADKNVRGMLKRRDAIKRRAEIKQRKQQFNTAQKKPFIGKNIEIEAIQDRPQETDVKWTRITGSVIARTSVFEDGQEKTLSFDFDKKKVVNYRFERNNTNVLTEWTRDFSDIPQPVILAAAEQLANAGGYTSNLKDYLQLTPLQLAVKNSANDIVDLLLQAGGPVWDVLNEHSVRRITTVGSHGNIVSVFDFKSDTVTTVTASGSMHTRKMSDCGRDDIALARNIILRRYGNDSALNNFRDNLQEAAEPVDRPPAATARRPRGGSGCIM